MACGLVASGAQAWAGETPEAVIRARSLEDTLPQELARYGHQVETVTAEQLLKAGYTDVSTALQFETPGLFVSPGSGPFDYVDVSLQGSRTGDVLWLVDGVRINNRIFNDTSPDTLPSSMVERIEVLKGAESLFYGTQGVAGAINIVTRSYSEEPDGKVTLSLDSNDGYHFDGVGRFAFGGHKFVVYASRDDAEGYEQYDPFEASATDRKRSYDVRSAGVKYGHDFSDRLRFDFLYHHTDAVLDNNSAARTRRAYNDRDEDILSARLDYALNDNVRLFLKGYLHDWDTTYANIQNDPVTGEEVVIFPPGTYWGYRDYGASALAKIAPGGALEYHLGYDFQNYKARDDVFPIAGRTETVHAAIGEIRTTEMFSDRLRLAGGARFNRGSGGKHATVWNLSGRYELTDTLHVEGVIGTAFLLPSAEQLYYVGIPGTGDYVGNPDLEPEESRNINLSIGGVTQAGSVALTWKLTGFARDIDNLIDVGFDNPLYPDGRYENVAGEVRVRGTDLALSAALHPALNLSTSFTLSRARNAGSDLQRPRIPERFAKATLEFAPASRPFGASATLNWTGDVYQVTSTFGRQRFGDHLVLNLAGHWNVGGLGSPHRLGIALKNAFDEKYATRLVEASRDDGSGRFLARRLGVPRTLQVSYTYDF